MAKSSTKQSVPLVEAHIEEQPITNALELNFMPYAMSVIISRAIPEMDGFKPAHRKLLYTMYKMGLLSNARGRVKSADIVGQTMRLNPHGDGPIYETMVRLTRGNDALLHPFVDSKGNFGKHSSRDMAYAASRYTEAKLDDICKELFADIDKNVVDMVDNYNATMLEPTLFPTTFPNLLVTPNQGIAVSMASTVASFNLKEVNETAIAWLKNPKHTISKTLLAPDFSTGGELLYNRQEIENIYATGRGSFKLRARYRFDKKNSCIEVYEIPYTTTAEAIIDKVVALVKANKVRDIQDVRDETDLHGLKIAIDIRKSANPDQIMQRLFSLTTLQDSFNCNFNFLVKGRPRVMGIAEILEEWTAFRIGCIKRGLAYDIDKKSEKLHLLEGLAKILLDIDKAIKIIRQTEKEKDVVTNLMKGFGITQPQAEFVAEIRLRHLNREYLLGRVNEQDDLRKEIGELKSVYGSEEKIRALIISQLKEVAKKYGKPRRTEIVYDAVTEKPAEEVFIDDFNLKLFLTGHNYLKKISLVSLRSAGEHNLKENDFIAQELETSNREEILFFSSQNNVYKMRLHDIPDCRASSLGEYLTNLLGLEPGERIVYMTAANEYKGYMVFAFENGKAAKVPLAAYITKTNRKKLVNAFSDKSPLVNMVWLPEDADLFLKRGKDKAMVLNTVLIPVNTSKASGGLTVFTLRKNTVLTEMRLANKETEDNEYYRADKVPTAGHFIKK
jgi:DNA gyrase subunit A